MSGIFISKGVSLRIPVGGLRISLGDEPQEQQGLICEVHFDVCPSWVEIALDHLAATKEANAVRTQAWQNDNADEKGRSLEREFKASMQGMRAAAVALESFYRALLTKIDAAEWTPSNGPRFAQMTEACKRAFTLSEQDVKELRYNLQQIFKFRNRAVHPASDFTRPVLHPELGVGVEWRFVTFRFENALPLIWATVNTIAGLVSNRKATSEQVQKYIDYLKPQFEVFKANEMIATWTPPPPTSP